MSRCRDDDCLQHPAFLLGYLAGAVSDARWAQFESARRDMLDMKKLLKSTTLSPQAWTNRGITVQFDGIGRK
jgi:tRNA uridine 5-carboxymethylaminomethyl modification enzyme